MNNTNKSSMKTMTKNLILLLTFHEQMKLEGLLNRWVGVVLDL